MCSRHDWFMIQTNYFKKLKEIYCYSNEVFCEKTYDFGTAFFLYFELNHRVPTFDEFIKYLEYKGVL